MKYWQIFVKTAWCSQFIVVQTNSFAKGTTFKAFHKLNVCELHNKFGTTSFHKIYSSPNIIRSQGSSVGIMHRLQAVQPRSWGVIPASCKRLQPFPQEPDWLWSPTRILFSGYWWYCNQDVKYAIYLHVFMTLGMHGAAVLLPLVPLWHAQGQLYRYLNTVCLVRSSSMRKTGHAYTGEMINAYKFFTGKSEGKRPLD